MMIHKIRALERKLHSIESGSFSTTRSLYEITENHFYGDQNS